VAKDLTWRGLSHLNANVVGDFRVFHRYR